MTFRATRGELVLTDDPAALDEDAIVALLHDTYWAADRPAETIRASLRGSRCFGVRTGDSGLGPQLGFCRVVTDGATFAWLCDVVIDPSARGRGIGTWMVGAVIEQLRAIGIGRMMLRTGDAHELYRRFGFGELTEMDTWMQALN